jgi:hypothetical protein
VTNGDTPCQASGEEMRFLEQIIVIERKRRGRGDLSTWKEVLPRGRFLSEELTV